MPPLIENKLYYFEGLRGLAALIVFSAHFQAAFCIDYNLFDINDLQKSFMNHLVYSIIATFWDGELPVNIFWFMSAYLISFGLFNEKKNHKNVYLLQATTKRYFRLAIPVLISSGIYFILLYTDLFFHKQVANLLGEGYKNGWLNSWYNFQPNLFGFIKTTLIELWLNGNSSYNMVLWTMRIELLGSFLCFSIFALYGKLPWRTYIYVILILVFLVMGIDDKDYLNYLLFIFGLLWADTRNGLFSGLKFNFINKFIESKLFWFLLLVICFILPVLYPSLFGKENLIYLFSYLLKAISITLLVHKSHFLRNLLSTKFFRFLGLISFPLYLLHIAVLFTFGCFLFLKIYHLGTIGLIIVFVSCLFLTIVASWLFYNLVDKPSLLFINKHFRFLFEDHSLLNKNKSGFTNLDEKIAL